MRSACLEPLGPNAAVDGGRGRCREHATRIDQAARQDRPGRAIYSTARWRNTRRRYLFRHPICETPGCRRIATQVHHRIDLADGGDPWDPAGLEALCASCHSKETRRTHRRTAGG
jgi:5-methylcytosine-specific restriction protein A